MGFSPAESVSSRLGVMALDAGFSCICKRCEWRRRGEGGGTYVAPRVSEELVDRVALLGVDLEEMRDQVLGCEVHRCQCRLGEKERGGD